MKAESNLKPETVVIERTDGGMCDVIINANVPDEPEIVEYEMGEETEQMERYVYDYYRFPLSYRTNLKNEIEANLDAYIEYAEALENQPKELTDKEKIAALMADNELLRGCVMELADVLFA